MERPPYVDRVLPEGDDLMTIELVFHAERFDLAIECDEALPEEHVRETDTALCCGIQAYAWIKNVHRQVDLASALTSRASPLSVIKRSDRQGYG